MLYNFIAYNIETLGSIYAYLNWKKDKYQSELSGDKIFT